ncbi:MAG: TetR/AcrR family transcriptional regulator [Woeseiaceae bacterium]|jgi:AcrR family transcriptional regulator
MPHADAARSDPEQSLTQAERTALAETRMVRAAIELLSEAGVRGTTLVAIGERSGYSRGLATHHFGSKAGLFRTVLKRLSAAWSRELTRALAGKSGIEALEIAIDTHLAHVLRHPEYIRVQYILWGAAIDPSSEFKPNVTEFMQIQRESVADWIADGQRRGEIQSELSAVRLAEQYYGALIGINQQWQVSPDFDLPAAYADFKRNFVRLLRAT